MWSAVELIAGEYLDICKAGTWCWKHFLQVKVFLTWATQYILVWMCQQDSDGLSHMWQRSWDKKEVMSFAEEADELLSENCFCRMLFHHRQLPGNDSFPMWFLKNFNGNLANSIWSQKKKYSLKSCTNSYSQDVHRHCVSLYIGVIHQKSPQIKYLFLNIIYSHEYSYNCFVTHHNNTTVNYVFQSYYMKNISVHSAGTKAKLSIYLSWFNF